MPIPTRFGAHATRARRKCDTADFERNRRRESAFAAQPDLPDDGPAVLQLPLTDRTAPCGDEDER